MTAGAEAGETLEALRSSFPAAVTTTIPLATMAAVALLKASE